MTLYGYVLPGFAEAEAGKSGKQGDVAEWLKALPC